MAASQWPVKVYIYDISKGLAKSISLPLLGKQIEGIWHTAVVIYDQEFFYGGSGIESCAPGHTVLGHPDTVIELGVTEVPCDIFMDHLKELSKTRFRCHDYNLMSHNCNTFTNDVAVFLTGRNIPRYVTDLPQDILNSPFGAMMKPFLDSMSVNPEGGHALFEPSSHDLTAQGSASSLSQAARPKASMSDTASGTGQETTAIPEAAMFTDDSVRQQINEMRSTFKAALQGREWKLLNEVIDYVSTANCLWSLGRDHIKLFGTLLHGNSLDTTLKVLVGRLLTLAVTHSGVVDMLRFDKKMSLMRMVSSADRLPPAVQVTLAKTLANCGSCKAGHEWLLNSTDWPIDSLVTNNKKIVCKNCIDWLLHEDSDLNSSAAALAYVLTRYKISEDVAMEIGTALIQLATKSFTHTVGEHILQSMHHCMAINSEVVDLASIMQLDLGKFASLSAKLKSLTKKIQDKMAPTS
ncbi:hypothetical protein NP493_93g01037 [Ridgeia piscesae]|uniref:PPPDE domain-containing protein n=1 Tax=Ridgeia piscesae TaxID=27915 RepID=A0AAD9UHV1_RIDPI|nr:hypothetical protein NP493_93g01037 [Ridgeia piscesae]